MGLFSQVEMIDSSAPLKSRCRTNSCWTLISKLFKKGGIRKIYTEPGTPKHEAYLLRMGFVQERATGDRILYARTIT